MFPGSCLCMGESTDFCLPVVYPDNQQVVIPTSKLREDKSYTELFSHYKMLHFVQPFSPDFT